MMEFGDPLPAPPTDENYLDQVAWSFLKDLKRITDSDVKGKGAEGLGAGGEAFSGGRALDWSPAVRCLSERLRSVLGSTVGSPSGAFSPSG